MNIKLIVYGVILSLLVAGVWHYRATIAKNAELVAKVLQLQNVNSELETALTIERRAAREAIEDRRVTEELLNETRRNRATDEASREWGETPVPPSAKERICTALQQSEC